MNDEPFKSQPSEKAIKMDKYEKKEFKETLDEVESTEEGIFEKPLNMYYAITEIGCFIVLNVVFLYLLNWHRLGYRNTWVPDTSYNNYYNHIFSILRVSFIVMGLLVFFNDYIHILTFSRKERIVGFFTRFIFITTAIAWYLVMGSLDETYFTISYFVILFYALGSNFSLKAYLLTTNKSIHGLLFQRPISGSPAENEWKRINFISGIIGIITGIFCIQFLWLLYHVFVRKYVINRKQAQLIIDSLQYEKETPLAPLALDLGLSLENVIYTLKQLIHKRHLDGKLTRYGFILYGIRKPKWFSQKIREKYEQYLEEKQLDQIEKHVNKIFEIVDKERIKAKEFKQRLNIKSDYSIENLEHLLPIGVMDVKKPLFSKKKIIQFNRNKMYMQRDRILQILKENYKEIFKNDI